MRAGDNTDVSFLRPVDSERFLNELDIPSRIRARASRDSEQAKRDEDAAFRSNIGARLDALRQSATADTNKRINLLADLIHQHGANIDFTATKNRIERDLNEMSVGVTVATGDIEHLRELYLEQTDHFQDYRARRRLKAPAAKPPDILKHTWQLYLFWGGEAVMNMFFFAGGNSLGFTGGLIFALLVSSVNIVFSFFVGFLFTKWTNSILIVKKLIGWIVSLSFGIALLPAHFVVAHYRAQQMLAAERGEFLPESEYFGAAVQALTSNFFLLPDFQSYILMGLGAFFGCFAWWKGYHFGDRYPGYTKEYRNLQERREDFEDEYTTLFIRLEKVRDEVVDLLEAFINGIGPSATAMNANAAGARNLVANYRTFLESCDTAESLAIREYVARTGGEPDSLGAAKSREGGVSAIHELEDLVARIDRDVVGAHETVEGVRHEVTEYRRLTLTQIGEIETEAKKAAGVIDGKE
jgi:hypothetical protein